MPGNRSGRREWPEDVGIVSMEVYFPSTYVDQTELEEFDGVSPGKYTIGLGQSKMGFCTDREDIHSLCLSVVQRLIENTGIHYSDIGRLEVGTETILDKSKSIKTVLMQLFEESGNTDIEGVDVTNACYGGTAALFNAVSWVESSAYDGRYALVVCGDIAVYASGNARCTGGAGAIAMLIGPNAPIVLDRGTRTSFMSHEYDFYKPDLRSEYPYVDGKLSIRCYLHALDMCYQGFHRKSLAAASQAGGAATFGLDNLNAVLFHSPYCKLVQKSLARIALNDFLLDPSPDYSGKHANLQRFRDITLSETYFDRDVEKAFLDWSRRAFESKTKPSLLLARNVGNMYTPSLYSCLASHIASHSLSELAGQRVALFSYGSGLAASMYSVRFSSDASPGSPLHRLHVGLSTLQSRLDARIKVPPPLFDATMKIRELAYLKAPYAPQADVGSLYPGVYYLTDVDDLYRRTYHRKDLTEKFTPMFNPVVVPIQNEHKIATTELLSKENGAVGDAHYRELQSSTESSISC